MPNSPTRLEKRLAAYAISAGVVLAAAPTTDAQVNHTDIDPDECEFLFGGISIDMDRDGTTEFAAFIGSVFSPLRTVISSAGGGPCTTVYCGVLYGGFVGLPRGAEFMTSRGFYAQALDTGDVVSARQLFGDGHRSALFEYGGGGDGNWKGGNDAMVGVRFSAEHPDTLNHGWVRIITGPENGNTELCVAEWAYEATAGLPILAGDRGVDSEIMCMAVGDPTIPASGGSYAFDIEIANNGATTENVEVWIDIEGPGVDVTRGPVRKTIPVGGISRALTQNIPGHAPAGEYTQTCNVGTFPDADSSSSFAFEKTEAFAPGDVSVLDWSTETELAAALAGDAPVEVVGTHQLSNAYPNPFNPTSQFTLAVAQKQHVTAELYNVLGQRVATLFDGSVEANASQIVQIDGSVLPSGIYVVQVAGDTFSDALRVTLTK